MTPRRVVTLPPSLLGDAALVFAEDVRRRGADLLELRNDLHADGAVDVERLAAILPLLVSERGRSVSPPWERHAALVDRPLESPLAARLPGIASHHAEQPLSPREALALWSPTPLADGAWLKHVEPLGPPATGHRLLETRALLRELAGHERVTVLAMGPLALPFRCVLAAGNALDYLAASPSWVAAPGQRLLDDAARERRARPGRPRLAILGTGIAGSRSPRIHPQPFDRLELPEDAPAGELVDALRPYYAGFAVTSPFKKPLAAHLGAPLEAVNTLVRRGDRWEAANTDVEGARAVLERLGGGEVTILGDGGTTAALRLAASAAGTRLRVVRARDVPASPLGGKLVWTWPERVGAPAPLTFERAEVAVIAYGEPARRIAAEIRRRGGRPLLLGARWFVAQARGQRRLWEEAT